MHWGGGVNTQYWIAGCCTGREVRPAEPGGRGSAGGVVRTGIWGSVGDWENQEIGSSRLWKRSDNQEV